MTKKIKIGFVMSASVAILGLTYHALIPTVSKKFLFVGDSITHAWGSYSALSDLPWYSQAVFAGVWGEPVEETIFRVREMRLNPKQIERVVVMIGINNFFKEVPNEPDFVADHVVELVNLIQSKLPDSKMLLLGVLPAWKVRGNQIEVRSRELNRLLASAKLPHGVKFRNIGDAFLDESGLPNLHLLYDFVHPSEAGYRVFSQNIKDFLE